MEKMSMSHEDYLEAIVMLGGTTEVSVRSVDIATKLDVSKASVNKAISSLKEKGLADQPYYGDITLTEEGYAYGMSSSTAITCCSRSSRERSASPRSRPRRKPASWSTPSARIVQKMEFLY